MVNFSNHIIGHVSHNKYRIQLALAKHPYLSLYSRSAEIFMIHGAVCVYYELCDYWRFRKVSEVAEGLQA